MRRILCTLFLCWSLSVQAQSDWVIVVAKDTAINELSEQHVSNIFLAKTESFPDGSKATPIELKNHPLKDDFYAAISGKSDSQLSAYWTTLVFTGKGKPPKGYRNAAALIENLLDLNGAITYIPQELVTNEMKVIYRYP